MQNMQPSVGDSRKGLCRGNLAERAKKATNCTAEINWQQTREILKEGESVSRHRHTCQAKPGTAGTV